MMSDGPAKRDVPVSTATWHFSPQSFWTFLSKVTSSIATCQYPAVVTGAQMMSPVKRSVLYSPNEISLGSSSVAPKNTEKRFSFKTFCLIMQSTRLKLSPSLICGSASPRIPSNGTSENGSSDSLVDATKLPLAQMSPTQILSLTKTPLVSPVPKVIVTTSRSPSGLTAASGWSAKAIWVAVFDFFGLYRLCDVHASSEQLVEGNKRLPDPVSKTTRKGWPPTEISP